jgi:hypothetical protein
MAKRNPERGSASDIASWAWCPESWRLQFRPHDCFVYCDYGFSLLGLLGVDNANGERGDGPTTQRQRSRHPE